jgi:hypothetical protein
VADAARRAPALVRAARRVLARRVRPAASGQRTPNQ